MNIKILDSLLNDTERKVLEFVRNPKKRGFTRHFGQALSFILIAVGLLVLGLATKSIFCLIASLAWLSLYILMLASAHWDLMRVFYDVSEKLETELEKRNSPNHH